MLSLVVNFFVFFYSLVLFCQIRRFYGGLLVGGSPSSAGICYSLEGELKFKRSPYQL